MIFGLTLLYVWNKSGLNVEESFRVRGSLGFNFLENPLLQLGNLLAGFDDV
jgi:hypothetical protein